MDATRKRHARACLYSLCACRIPRSTGFLIGLIRAATTRVVCLSGQSAVKANGRSGACPWASRAPQVAGAQLLALASHPSGSARLPGNALGPFSGRQVRDDPSDCRRFSPSSSPAWPGARGTR
eukprot:163070-Alexandrium_andersonii.AAC.1